ncbi:hypothetical protein [Mobilicoccus sp.]|uniref:hypothetical protein n=1 Tax=Mobilicoccus sp. TaxID=2034349 RepID=UPI0028AA85D6|nr:hypothetical protein [Mobilicoccus sp.]
MDDHPDLVRLHARPRHRLADLVGVVLDPLVVLAVTVLLVALATSPTVLAGLGWAAATMTFCALLPEIALRVVMRVHGIGDRQLVVREQRRIPLLLSAASIGVGVGVLVLAGAPRGLTALVVTVLVALVAMAIITRVWKASFHLACTATAVVVLALVLGPLTLAITLPMLGAVAWARTRAGRHGLAQVIAGALIGGLIAGAVFPALA